MVERKLDRERESGHYPRGGRQFSYSDWLIAQSCHEQEDTGHQESKEKWLELWVRRKEGQLFFLFKRENYVCCLRKSIWRGIGPCEENGEPFFLLFVLKLSNLMKGLRHLCWNSETSELLYNNGMKKKITHRNLISIFCSNPPVHRFFVCGLFCQLKGAWICHYSEWQLSELWLFIDLMPERDSKQEERDALQRLLVSCQCHLLISCSLGSALHISPLENNKELFRYSRDVYKRHLSWMWELLCTL